MPPSASKALVIGCGAAGLMAMDVLSAAGFQVTGVDRMPSLGRKVLRAGIGGLNVSHSEDAAAFLRRYHSDYPPLLQAIRDFGRSELEAFLQELGIATFVGSSGRIFPVAMKASPLLRAWKARLDARAVTWRLRSRWLGQIRPGMHQMETADGESFELAADVVILALGGASWPRLGSDGRWSTQMPEACQPFQASNVGVIVAADATWQRHHGGALKDCAVHLGSLQTRGDLLLTSYGLEGGAIYALTHALRTHLATNARATIRLDLRPQQPAAALLTRLQACPRHLSLSNRWRRAGFKPIEIDLVRDHLDRQHWSDDTVFVACLKDLPLQVSGLRPVAEAISSVGGLNPDSLDEHFMLKSWPGVFCAGEMLNFDAPTGGYLLTAAWASGRAAALAAVDWSAQMRAGGERL